MPKGGSWWIVQESNLGLGGYEPPALPVELTIRMVEVCGFEPQNTRVKVWGLSAWRYLSMEPV